MKRNDIVVLGLKASYLSDHWPDREWFSSAQYLDEALEKNGIEIPMKLFRKYNFPENMTFQQYDIDLHYFLMTCEKIDINRDKFASRVQELIELNPELSRIKMKDDDFRTMADFMLGVSFGFAPEEIDYVVGGLCGNDYKNKKITALRNARERIIDKFMWKQGYNYGYRLSPEKLNVISEAIRHKKPNIVNAVRSAIRRIAESHKK